jgi:hypothetical protein
VNEPVSDVKVVTVGGDTPAPRKYTVPTSLVRCQVCKAHPATKTRSDGTEVCLRCADGVTAPICRFRPPVGRNEPCPCGKGKKYKLCCMRPPLPPQPASPAPETTE